MLIFNSILASTLIMIFIILSSFYLNDKNRKDNIKRYIYIGLAVILAAVCIYTFTSLYYMQLPYEEANNGEPVSTAYLMHTDSSNQYYIEYSHGKYDYKEFKATSAYGLDRELDDDNVQIVYDTEDDPRLETYKRYKYFLFMEDSYNTYVFHIPEGTLDQ